MPSLADLSREFQPKADQLIRGCAIRGVTMRPYFTLRTPVKQAMLWRQSRSKEEIEAKVKFLHSQSAPYLAEVLESVGPQHGPKVTGALPGESWHQWGEAVDCFWVLEGKSCWVTPETHKKELPLISLNGYQLYADLAEELKLTPLGPTKLADWVHVQNFAHKVTDQYSWAEIDTEMQNRYDRVI